MSLRFCTRETAAYAVKNWHYSRSMSGGLVVAMAVWEEQRFVGAIVYGVGATSALCRPYGLQPKEGCELVRVALRAHNAPVSQMVSESLKMLRRTQPGLRLVVSFADPLHGHTGGIYQAGNWIYAGTTPPDRAFIVGGRRYHSRSIGSRGWVQTEQWLRAHVDPTARQVSTPPKHRYLMPLDRAMRRSIAGRAQPYPAAEVSIVTRPAPSG